MAQIVISINNQPYTMQCSDGEEGHLYQLAQLLDEEVTRLKQTVGTIGDIRLLVMAGLVVADRLSEAGRHIAELEGQLAAMAEQEAHIVERLASASQRLNNLVDQIE